MRTNLKSENFQFRLLWFTRNCFIRYRISIPRKLMNSWRSLSIFCNVHLVSGLFFELRVRPNQIETINALESMVDFFWKRLRFKKSIIQLIEIFEEGKNPILVIISKLCDLQSAASIAPSLLFNSAFTHSRLDLSSLAFLSSFLFFKNVLRCVIISP